MAQHPGGNSITFKDRHLIGADPRLLRDVRGDQISMIFQEPMTSLNPLHTVEKQINETLFLHKGMNRDQARRRSEEHTSELQSLMRISYAVFCLKKKNTRNNHTNRNYDTYTTITSS